MSSSSAGSVTGASSTLLQLARIIRRGDPVVFVTGSGLSAPSGIPTFRGTNGVWAKWVLDWGTRDAFLADPRAWYNKFWIPAHVVAEPGSTCERTYEPSAGHYAITELVKNAPGSNVHVITQNIDGLHGRAGLPADKLVEVHGRCGLFKCVTPGCRYAQTETIEGISLDLAMDCSPAAPAEPAESEPVPQAAGEMDAEAADAEAAGGGRNPAGSSSLLQPPPADGHDVTAAPSEVPLPTVATPHEPSVATEAPTAAAAAPAAEPAAAAATAPASAAAAAAAAEEAVDSAAVASRLAESGGGGSTVLGELPRCPACSAPALPQALLFDEDYESHSFYEYRKARRWLASAKAVVFVGTSFAVGVTEQALHLAAENVLPAYSFNVVTESTQAPHEASGSAHGERLPSPAMHHVLGGCEVTLPKLAALVGAPLAKTTALWYQGWIPGATEQLVIDSYGSGWTEETTGNERKMRARGKKRDRDKPVPRHETTWVACDACGKWRKLPPGVVLPDEAANSKWQCRQNVWDPARRSCDVPEEPWV
jgi:NAD-dependent SIR2 family protein deacetylase